MKGAGMNLREVHQKFSTDEQCLQYIEKMRWPDGIVRCPVCGAKDAVKVERKATSKNKRGWFYLCSEASCRQQFSPTSGTIFHDTKLPLIVWFQAVALMLNAKKGISAKQLQRDLGIGGYKTAWYLNHRIREVMAVGDIPKLGGVVEIDETYIGGKKTGQGVKAGIDAKDTVVGIRERGGELRLMKAENATSAELAKHITKHVSRDVKMVVTDELNAYPKAFILSGIKGSKVETIKHKDEIYVRGIVHTNTIESAFSLLKRGIIGNFHKVSIKHLQRYLDEFSYRFNRRNDEGAFTETVRRLCGFAPLPFAELVSDETV